MGQDTSKVNTYQILPPDDMSAPPQNYDLDWLDRLYNWGPGSKDNYSGINVPNTNPDWLGMHQYEMGILNPGQSIPPASGGQIDYNPPGYALDPKLITSSGYLTGSGMQLLIPMYDPRFKRRYIGTFNYADFNTDEAASYFFKAEQVQQGRQITVSRVRIVYRDLGVFKLRATVTSAQNVASQENLFGGRRYGSLQTDYFDMIVTGERPQLVLSRSADMGPVSIISAAMITDVEITEQI